MSLEPVVASALGRDIAGGQSLIQVAGKVQWLDSLTVGQILKGRILRHYGEGRYGVNFAGHERVVDSGVPLSVGDILSGKVIGVSEHSVSMQLVRNTKSSTRNMPDILPEKKAGTQVVQSMITKFMEQSRVRIGQADVEAIAKAAGSFSKPEMAIKVGLYLTKLGLPISKELVLAISKQVLEPQSVAKQRLDKNIPELASDRTDRLTGMGEQPQALATEFLAKYFLKSQSSQLIGDEEIDMGHLLPPTLKEFERFEPSRKGASDSDRDGKSKDTPTLAQCFSRLFNIQTGATYRHRFETLPIIIDGRVSEFDLALFDHSPNAVTGVRSRHLRFSLQTHYGPVVLSAHVLNNRVHLQLMAESEWMAKEFEMHQDDLSRNLSSAGWKLELSEYKSGSGLESPAEAVIEHVLAQDSLRMAM